MSSIDPQVKLRSWKKIIKALSGFKGKHHMKFNFKELCRQLECPDHRTISEGKVLQIIEILMSGQNLFDTVLVDHFLTMEKSNGTIYLRLKKKPREFMAVHEVSANNAKKLRDVVYIYQQANRGKYFDLQDGNKKMVQKITQLKEEHPVFFDARSNGKAYLSPIAVELGKKLLAYDRMNKKVDSITIKKHIFRILK